MFVTLKKTRIGLEWRWFQPQVDLSGSVGKGRRAGKMVEVKQRKSKTKNKLTAGEISKRWAEEVQTDVQSSGSKKEAKILCVCVSGAQICDNLPFFRPSPASARRPEPANVGESIDLCLPGFYFHSATSLSSIQPGAGWAAVISMCICASRVRGEVEIRNR